MNYSSLQSVCVVKLFYQLYQFLHPFLHKLEQLSFDSRNALVWISGYNDFFLVDLTAFTYLEIYSLFGAFGVGSDDSLIEQ